MHRARSTARRAPFAAGAPVAAAVAVALGLLAKPAGARASEPAKRPAEVVILAPAGAAPAGAGAGAPAELRGAFDLAARARALARAVAALVRGDSRARPTVGDLAEIRRARRAAAAAARRWVARAGVEDPLAADALLLIAELEMEEAEDEWDTRLRALDADAALEAMGERGGGGRALLSPEGPELEVPLGTALRLLAAHPHHARAGAAAYLVGMCLAGMGRPAEARAAFERLATGWPSSPLATEAWFRAGEAAFDAGDLAGAAAAYERAAADRGWAHRPIALYKLGWTHYRAEAWGPAIDRWLELLALEPGDGGAALFRDEAVTYVAIAVAEATPGGGALALLRKAVPLEHGAAWVIAVRAGDVLRDAARPGEAAEVWGWALATWGAAHGSEVDAIEAKRKAALDEAGR